MFSSEDWTYEPKWDGLRVLTSIRDGHVRLLSRHGQSFTKLSGLVADALRRFPTSLVLDGEVIAINNKGQPDFEALQARLRPFTLQHFQVDAKRPRCWSVQTNTW